MPSASEIPKNTGATKTSGSSQSRLQNAPAKPNKPESDIGQGAQQSPNLPQAKQQEQESGGPGQIASSIGGGGGDMQSQIAGQAQKRGMSALMAVPEAIVMLPIALALDLAGMVLFILSLLGVGVPISFLLTIMGAITIGFWATTRTFFKGVMNKAVSNIAEQATGGAAKQPGQPSQAPGAGLGKKAAKTGLKLGLSTVRFLVSFLIELIPFVGNVFPSWTVMVIFELIQGEI